MTHKQWYFESSVDFNFFLLIYKLSRRTFLSAVCLLLLPTQSSRIESNLCISFGPWHSDCFIGDDRKRHINYEAWLLPIVISILRSSLSQSEIICVVAVTEWSFSPVQGCFCQVKQYEPNWNMKHALHFGGKMSYKLHIYTGYFLMVTLLSSVLFNT